MRRTLVITTLLALALGACGGPPANAAGAFPVTVRDCGREVTIAEPPQRIVTIGAEAPALVAEAGGADRSSRAAASTPRPWASTRRRSRTCRS